MMTTDPAILESMLCERDRRIADLEKLLCDTRTHAVHWEHEAKALRKQIQRMRMDADTERIAKG